MSFLVGFLLCDIWVGRKGLGTQMISVLISVIVLFFRPSEFLEFWLWLSFLGLSVDRWLIVHMLSYAVVPICCYRNLQILTLLCLAVRWLFPHSSVVLAGLGVLYSIWYSLVASLFSVFLVHPVTSLHLIFCRMSIYTMNDIGIRLGTSGNSRP